MANSVFVSFGQQIYVYIYIRISKSHRSINSYFFSCCEGKVSEMGLEVSNFAGPGQVTRSVTSCIQTAYY